MVLGTANKGLNLMAKGRYGAYCNFPHWKVTSTPQTSIYHNPRQSTLRGFTAPLTLQVPPRLPSLQRRHGLPYEFGDNLCHRLNGGDHSHRLSGHY